jgi:hypothetical protein
VPADGCRAANSLRIREILRALPVHSAAAITFRSLSPATKPSRLKAERNFGWLKEIAAWLGRYIEMPPLYLPSFERSAMGNLGDPASIERMAEECRAFRNPGHGPVGNVVRLMERAGCRVARLRPGPSGVEVRAPGLDALVALKKERKCSVAAMICRSEQPGIFDRDKARRARANWAGADGRRKSLLKIFRNRNGRNRWPRAFS